MAPPRREASPATVSFSASSKDGTYTVLHSFTGSDGQAPIGTLVRDEAGNLYGVASAGGETSSGALFELTANGTIQRLA